MTDSEGDASDVEDSSSEDDEGEQCRVERILNKKSVKGRVFYLVKWKGYSRAAASWDWLGACRKPRWLQRRYRRV